MVLYWTVLSDKMSHQMLKFIIYKLFKMCVAEVPLDFENAADSLYSLLKTWTVAETKQKN